MFRLAIWVIAVCLQLAYRAMLLISLPLYMAMTAFGTTQNKHTAQIGLEFYPLFFMRWPRPPSIRSLRIWRRRETTESRAITQEILPPLE